MVQATQLTPRSDAFNAFEINVGSIGLSIVSTTTHFDGDVDGLDAALSLDGLPLGLKGVVNGCSWQKASPLLENKAEGSAVNAGLLVRASS